MDSDLAVDKELLQQACDGLKGSVSWYIRKCRKKSRLSESSLQDAIADANRAVDHACFLLEQLSYKRISLWHGVLALKHNWNTSYRKALEQDVSKDSNNGLDVPHTWLPILSRFFQHYIRLRDGFVLLVSGECRQNGDVPLKKHPSRLGTLSFQSDGYTRLYSAPRGYTGFGWDEFFQETVGIQTRLLEALHRIRYGEHNGSIPQKRRAHIWDALLDHGAQIFESTLDQPGSPSLRAKNEWVALRTQFCNDVSQLLNRRQSGSTVHMETLDKAERLTVNIPNQTEIRLERLADNFQVNDKGGVLPNGWTQSDWNRVMSLPLTKNNNKDSKARTSSDPKRTFAPRGKQVVRKRRRIIDSDDDSEEEKEKAPATSAPTGGLRVRVDKKEEETLPEASSLNKIKMGLGVNAEDLQASRQIAEREDKQDGNADGNSEEVMELLGEIQATRIQVKSSRRVLNRVLEKQNLDVFEIWDARESLRESIMALGSFFLSLHAALHEQDPKKSSGVNLEEAEKLFREAIDLVKQQTTCHDQQSQETSELSLEESRMIQRNLLLLGGRAHTNLGISLVERSLLMCKSKKASLLGQGITEFKIGKEASKEIRERAVNDGREHRADSVEISLDMIRATQLGCLATRWLGNALWHQGRRNESQATLESAAAMFRASEDNDSDLLDERISLGVECYYSATTLSDFALEALERIPTASFRTANKHGEDLFALACRGYELAKTTSNDIYTLTVQGSLDFRNIQLEHDVMSVEDISSHLLELRKWWDQRKSNAGSSIPHRQSKPDLPRNDLFPDGPSRSSKLPRRGFVVGAASRRRSKAKTHGAASVRASYIEGQNNYSFDPFAFDFEDQSVYGESTARGQHGQSEKIKFRKWGDEVLPQVSGSGGIKLFYPACAPEKPRSASSSQ